MPKATTTAELVRHELKTLEGAYVVLKKLNYGQFLQRQDMALQIGYGQSSSRKGDGEMTIKTTQTAITQWEFQTCIVEHNLEDETGRTLNFASQTDFALLDPIVGQEIGRYIDELTQFDQERFRSIS